MVRFARQLVSVGSTRARIAKIVWLGSWLLPLLLGAAARAADKPALSARACLSRFAREWQEQTWTNKSRFRPHGYMRPLKDEGWKLRMQTLQALVAHAEAAVPDLIVSLKSNDVAERILAAQTLSFLAPQASVNELFKAASTDEDAAVRLYAVDALGMCGKPDLQIDWDSLTRKESNRDVKKHIRYAIERKSEPIAAQVIQQLIDWDSSQMSTAAVGELAPDFALESATGERVRLSQYRGKKAVVLVFVYGDT